MASWAPGTVVAPFRSRASASRKISPTERALARARYARHADEQAQGKLSVDALEVVLPGPFDCERSTVGNFAGGGNGDRFFAREVLTGQALGCFGEVGDGPLSDDLAPLDARPRPEVDQVVGAPHGVFIMLDDDDRIPELGQATQGEEQSDRYRADAGPIDGSSRIYKTPTRPAPT